MLTRRIKLLYLEDDKMDQRALLRMVQEKNLPYDMTLAETLAQARTRLAESKFDLIVSDYHLPDGEGIELFVKYPDTPFVLLTSTLEESLALRTLERGADDYLVKTADQRHLEVLPFTVEKTLRRQHVRDRERRLTRDLLSSEVRFHLLVESVKDYAIYMLDRDGYVTTWNVGAERIKGWKAAEILDRHFSIFFTPEDAAAGKPQQELEIARREGCFREQARRVRKDGSAFWADITLTAVKDEHGDLIGFGKVTRDITERRRAEEALLEKDADLQLALNAGHFCLWKWDLIADRLTFSEECLALFGFKEGGARTYPRFIEAIHPEDRERFDEGISHALELRISYNAEVRVVWPDRSVHWLNIVGRGYYDAQSGEALRMAGVAFESTQESLRV